MTTQALFLRLMMLLKETFSYCLTLLLLLQAAVLSAQTRLSADDYIIRYKDIAIEKMQQYHIPASITLAQGLLESGNGNSILAREANNHFGIKCHKEWTGKTFFMDDDEKNECFRSYKHAEASFDDHSHFLTTRSRYAGLFVLDIMDYKAWAEGLKKAGYATNPRYPELLVNLIEKHRLFHYDSLAMGYLKEKQNEGAVMKADVVAPNPVIRPSEFEVTGKTKSGRYIHKNNGVKLIFVMEGDSPESLAKELGIYSWQIRSYNELQKNEALKAGDYLYVEKKARKSHDYKVHYLEKGETLRMLSQRYGVRLSRLEKMNRWPEGFTPPVGTRIRLR